MSEINKASVPTTKIYKSGKARIINTTDKADWEAKGWSDSESSAPKKAPKKSPKKWSDDK